ncbi:MAG TPA: GNAT family N-acetyltransferase [Blastocatellia bacterium]|nr:GNAT family N-acetyltransferase [Blastocatellia bacterium]
MQNLHADKEVFGRVKLRPAAADDQAFLLGVFASTRGDELALLNGDENQKAAFINMQFNAQSRQYLASYPHADNSIVLLNDDPVGRLLVDRGAREFTLVDVALLPSHRGAGIGTHLIADLLREAAGAAKPVNLSVWHSNPAKKLYERLGFSVANDDGVYWKMSWQPTTNACQTERNNY